MRPIFSGATHRRERVHVISSWMTEDRVRVHQASPTPVPQSDFIALDWEDQNPNPNQIQNPIQNQVAILNQNQNPGRSSLEEELPEILSIY